MSKQPCHFCRGYVDEHDGARELNGLTVCPDCFRSIASISKVMQAPVSDREPDGLPMPAVTFFDPKLIGVYEELSAQHVANVYSSVTNGWRPLVLFYTEEVSVENFSGSGDFHELRVNIPTQIPVRKAMFLMGRTSEASKKEAELRKLDAELEEAKKQQVALEETIDKLLDLNNENNNVMRILDKRCDELGEERNEVQDAAKRMEQDLGKLRKALGDIKFKEILEDE